MSDDPPRRRLLHAAAAEVRAIADELHALVVEAAPPERLIRVRRRAMACWFEVLMPADRAEWTPAAVAALDEVQRVESWMSTYAADSELSRVNRDAGRGFVRISAELADFLAACRHWSERTGGAFDAASGALIELWGFMSRTPRRPSESEIAAALAKSGFCHVRLDERARTVSFDHLGVSVNPGAIGKGWAIDRAAAIFRDSGADNFLIQAGGSSARAVGAGLGGNGWNVAIPSGARLYSASDPSPRRLSEAQVVFLRDRALAASGGQEQSFEHAGTRYAHIIDPRSGMASTREDLVCVTAACAAAAEACSTAIFVMSDGEAAKFAGKAD